MIPNLEEIYCLIDNLTSLIDKKINSPKVGRKKKLSRSELLIIAVIKQKLGISTNKQLYLWIRKCMQYEFPLMPSYQQFCAGLEPNFFHLGIINMVLLHINKQKYSEFFVIDSTPLPLCSVGYRPITISHWQGYSRVRKKHERLVLWIQIASDHQQQHGHCSL